MNEGTCWTCNKAPQESGWLVCPDCRKRLCAEPRRLDVLAESIVEQAGPATELRLKRRADEVAVRFYRDKLALVLARMRREIRDARIMARSPVIGNHGLWGAEANAWSNAAALVRFADRRGIHPTLRTMLRDRDATLGSEAR